MLVTYITYLFLDYQYTVFFSGETTGNNSLFTLPDPDYDASFVPLFFDDIDALFGNNTALKKKAEDLCGKKQFECLFDVALTADTQAAAESKSSQQDFESEKKTLSKLSFWDLA